MSLYKNMLKVLFVKMYGTGSVVFVRLFCLTRVRECRFTRTCLRFCLLKCMEVWFLSGCFV